MARAGWAAGHEPGAELCRSSARSLRFSAPERGGASGAGIADARGALGRPDPSPHSCSSPTARGGGLGPGARLRAEPRGVGNRAPRAGSPGNVAASEGVPRPRRLLRAERKRWAGGGAWLPAPLCSLGAGKRVSSAQSWVPGTQPGSRSWLSRAVGAECPLAVASGHSKRLWARSLLLSFLLVARPRLL
jgi:hypothetical protein